MLSLPNDYFIYSSWQTKLSAGKKSMKLQLRIEPNKTKTMAMPAEEYSRDVVPA